MTTPGGPRPQLGHAFHRRVATDVLVGVEHHRYLLERDARARRCTCSCVRWSPAYAHTGSSPAARLGAVAFIHRFGAALNPHRHFHCVVIDGVFDAAAAGAIIFHAATGIDANAIVWVQAQVRRRHPPAVRH